MQWLAVAIPPMARTMSAILMTRKMDHVVASVFVCMTSVAQRIQQVRILLQVSSVKKKAARLANPLAKVLVCIEPNVAWYFNQSTSTLFTRVLFAFLQTSHSCAASVYGSATAAPSINSDTGESSTLPNVNVVSRRDVGT